MKNLSELRSGVDYARNLVSVGLGAAASTRHGAENLATGLGRATRAGWKSAAVGTAIGFLGVYSSRTGRSGSRVILGSLVGGALGFMGGFAWASRDVVGPVAGNVAKQVGTARDAHWLQKNPIAYA